jgi:hypothetical protein
MCRKYESCVVNTKYEMYPVKYEITTRLIYEQRKNSKFSFVPIQIIFLINFHFCQNK